jgi:hypothetical protein
MGMRDPAADQVDSGAAGCVCQKGRRSLILALLRISDQEIPIPRFEAPKRHAH